MVDGIGSSAPGTRRMRYLLTLAGALLLGLATALPVFAAEEPATGEDQPVQPQVVGGEPVPNGKYPFMVSIQANTSGASPYEEHFCGGSLIDRDSVLTAAHCADFIGAANVPGVSVSFRDVRVVVGTTELNSGQGQARRIERLSDVVKHPGYNSRTFQNDAAVIELNNPVAGIAPIPLAGVGTNGLERPGRRATIAGWGNTRAQPPDGSAPDSFPNRMHEARVPLVSDREAESVYGRRYFPGVMVAAGEQGRDTCQGDSGGPMFAATESGRRQIGITSLGTGCATARYPGVYTEVNARSIRSFITQAAR